MSGWHQLTNTPRGLVRLTLQWDPADAEPNLCSEDVYGEGVFRGLWSWGKVINCIGYDLLSHAPLAAHTKINPGSYGPFLMGALFSDEDNQASALHNPSDVHLREIIDDCLYVSSTSGACWRHHSVVQPLFLRSVDGCIASSDIAVAHVQ